MKKLALDELLVERGFIPSKEEAKRYIMAGKILIDDIVITKPGTLCNPKSRVRLKEKKSEFVSRGGDKIWHFIEKNNINVKDKCCLDIGISTGGFSDVLLRKEALHILGIDVGYGILDYQLRRNNQLSLLERTNAREVTKEEINTTIQKHHLSAEDIQLVVMDVSFISIFKILPNLIEILEPTTEYLVLVKPQFEAPKEMVDIGGIITSEDDLKNTLNKVEENLHKLNFNIKISEPSQLKGAKGNQEFFYYLNLNNTTSE
tara:strand:+ start:1564 stop:2343 length:780 start_codon:yes stop_codon:yes gene_type:complete